LNGPLTHLTVANFRTLRGEVSVPLDASIVLVHGANGAGKTSLLSAIELAATGAVQALQDFDPGYVGHLAHVGGGPCRVSLTGATARGSDDVGAISVSDGRLEGQALLAPSLRRFFSDRCFLAQSRLSRLLEIYQHAEARQESPLVRFVNELLGLDQLDELIAGLHPAMDERRVRRLVPDYESQQREVSALEQSVRRSNSSLGELRPLARQQMDAMREALGLESTRTVTPSPSDLSELSAHLAPDGSEDELETLRLSEARLDVIESQMRSLPASAIAGDSVLLASERAIAEQAAWREASGRVLADLLADAALMIGQIGSDWLVDPQAAWQECLVRAQAATAREVGLIAEDERISEEIRSLSAECESARRQLAEVDDRLQTLTLDSNGLIEVLSAIAPHITTDECPVCGRDFADMGTGSLSAHVQREIEAFSEEAIRIQDSVRARGTLQEQVGRSVAALEVAQGLLRSDSLRDASETRLQSLSTIEARLAELSSEVARGSEVIREADLRIRESREAGAVQAVEAKLRSSVADEWHRLFGPDDAVQADLPAMLTKLRSEATRRRDLLNSHIASRQMLRSQLQRIERDLAQIEDLEQKRRLDQQQLSSRTAALGLARDRFMSARSLANVASETRADIVARVFNGALNKTWHDLFIRLAADEPFVPYFGIPTSNRRLTAVELGTRHRVGTSGGSPGAMLSAGNLNTAALTLFLALHLTAEAQFKCLLLDDPVQSMDEVHVSQLAALLKTISRQHDRQIILAVHERALFEYLRLEMSPTEPGSHLVTLELERRDGADTECKTTVVTWTEDQSVLSLADTA